MTKAEIFSSSPEGLGSWVKKFQSREDAPSRTRKKSTRKIGAITAMAQTNINPDIAPLVSLRQACRRGEG